MRVTASSASSHCACLRRAVDAEAAQFHLRTGFSGTELHAAARDQVERRDALGHPRRMIEVGRKLDDAVAQAHALRALAGGGQKHLGCARVRILLQEMMLHFPDRFEADAVGQFHLFERVAQQLFLGAFGPRPRHLVFVEEPNRMLSRSPPLPGPIARAIRASARRPPSGWPAITTERPGRRARTRFSSRARDSAHPCR